MNTAKNNPDEYRNELARNADLATKVPYRNAAHRALIEFARQRYLCGAYAEALAAVEFANDRY